MGSDSDRWPAAARETRLSQPRALCASGDSRPRHLGGGARTGARSRSGSAGQCDGIQRQLGLGRR